MANLTVIIDFSHKFLPGEVKKATAAMREKITP